MVFFPFISDFADQTPKHMNFGQYIASNLPSLKFFSEESTNQNTGISTLRALSSAMLFLQRFALILENFATVICLIDIKKKNKIIPYTCYFLFLDNILI